MFNVSWKALHPLLSSRFCCFYVQDVWSLVRTPLSSVLVMDVMICLNYAGVRYGVEVSQVSLNSMSEMSRPTVESSQLTSEMSEGITQVILPWHSDKKPRGSHSNEAYFVGKISLNKWLWYYSHTCSRAVACRWTKIGRCCVWCIFTSHLAFYLENIFSCWDLCFMFNPGDALPSVWLSRCNPYL